MENTYIFKNNLQSSGFAVGSLTQNNLPVVKVGPPAEFGGTDNTLWTPEHLLVASVNTCLMTTFAAVAKNSKLEYQSYSAEAEGKVEKANGVLMFTEIIVKPKIVVSDNHSAERAERIINKSKNICLISNSLKTKVTLIAEIIIG